MMEIQVTEKRKYVILFLVVAVFLAVSSGLVVAKMITGTEGKGTMEAAAFVVEAAGDGESEFRIDYLDGTDRYYSAEYPFTVTNKADGKICEVSAEYDASVVIEAVSGSELPDGIEIRIDGQKVACTHYLDENSGYNIYKYTLEHAGKFEAGVERTKEHAAKITIDSEKVDSSLLQQLSGTVKIHAEQID